MRVSATSTGNVECRHDDYAVAYSMTEALGHRQRAADVGFGPGSAYKVERPGDDPRGNDEMENP